MKSYISRTTSYKVERLLLDTDNKRISQRFGTSASQKEVVIKLLEAQDRNTPIQIMELIKADGAFIEHFRPVLYKEGSKLIVADGNSRVCALKLTLNTQKYLDPINGKFKKVKRLADDIRGLIGESVSCDLAANKACAQKIVYRAHNQGSRKWSTMAKHLRHYEMYTEEESSINEIATYTKTPNNEITESINVWSAVTYINTHQKGLLGNLDLDSTSSFTRVFQKVEFQKAFDIVVDHEKVYQFPNDNSLLAPLVDLYERTAKTSGASRDYNTKPEIEELIEDLKIKHGNNKPTIKQPIKTVDPRTLHVNLANNTSTQPKPRPTTTADSPIVQAVSTISQYNYQSKVGTKKYTGQKSHKLYKELKSLTVPDHPISRAIVTRALVECCLKHFSQKFGTYVETPENKGNGYSASTEEIKNQIVRHIKSKNLNDETSLIKGINQLVKNCSSLSQVIHANTIFENNQCVDSTLSTLNLVVEELTNI